MTASHTYGQIIATLVVGSDGSTSKDGSSRGVSSSADRSRFLERRRSVDAILIGGNTARNEPYRKTPVPVVVV
jgi:riboflavin biosynthesis pyrimidine reductase